MMHVVVMASWVLHVLAPGLMHLVSAYFQSNTDLDFYFNDEKETTDLRLDDTLDVWNHHCLVFSHPGFRIYVNGRLSARGRLSSPALDLPLNGTLYLGQEQDRLDGGLDPHQSFSGLLAQVNLWDYALQDDVIHSIANCTSNDQGNVLAFDTAPVELSEALTEVLGVEALCARPPRFVIVPERKSPSEAAAFCELADSRFYIPTEGEANERLFNDSRQFVGACGGKSYKLLFLGATDREEEGHWVRTHDGRPLSYTAWGSGEPNGGRKRNCLVQTKHSDRWGDVECDQELCFVCGRTNVDFLQLRGLCHDDEHQTRFLFDGYLRGKPFFRGYYTMLIFHSGDKEWLLQDTTDNVTVAVLSLAQETGFPIGRQTWRMSSSLCGFPAGAAVVLGLSTCTTQEFMCTDGSCVHRGRRCNLRDDCADGSDEQNCTIVHFSDSYHNHRPPPGPSVGAPLEIDAGVELIRFSKIDDINLAFNMEIEVALAWTDSNLRYKNLKEQEGWNKLSSLEVEKIWSPDVEFLNVNNGELRRLKSGVFVQRLGEADPPVFTDVKMDTMYQAQAGRLVQREQYYGSFNCHFGLFHYPFDTQSCSILVKLASADTQVIVLRNGSVFYNGRSELPKYSIRNIAAHLTARSDYAVLQVTFDLERRWSLLVLTIFMPTFLLLGIGYGTLYIQLKAFQVRAIMTLTTLLVLYTLFNQVSSALPDTAYIKMIDMWFFFCIFLIFSVIIVHIAVERLEPGEAKPPKTVRVSPAEQMRPEGRWLLRVKSITATQVLEVSRKMVFPLIVSVFALVYWLAIFVH
ncbi:uncharacterized protein [Penaeus vannamei]|uniref:uncharacterized protein isoform X2 n=1 Tax=Penaeus vannamei TaxID=6689 RepID=UPI00387F5EB7